MNNSSAASLIVAMAAYALVAGAGVVGILLSSSDASSTPLVTTWLGFVGTSGLIGAVIMQNRRIEDHTKSLTNGALEKRVRSIMGEMLVSTIGKQEREWQETERQAQSPESSREDTQS